LEAKYQRILDRFDDVGELALAYEVCEKFGIPYSDDMFFGTCYRKAIPEKIGDIIESYICKAIAETDQSGIKYKLNRSQINSLARDLREVIQPMKSLFESSEIHRKNDNPHAQSDISNIIKKFSLPYSLDGSKDTHYLHRIENNE